MNSPTIYCIYERKRHSKNINYIDQFRFEMNARIDALEQIVTNIENQMNLMTKAVGEMRDEITKINHRLQRLETRIF